MKKVFESINLDIKEVAEFIENNGLSFICNDKMQVEASEEDFNKLIEQFPELDYVELETKAKDFGITAADENSIFVWSSPFAKSFDEMPEVTDDMIVVITNAQHTYVTIYNVKDFSEEDIDRVIKRHCSYVTQGCNYGYKLIKRVGNCYFVN